MLIAFHKPYGVISQFSTTMVDRPTLMQYHFPPNIYPLGRLDSDSEGLLLLSDEKNLNQRLLHPKYGHERKYWVQVERIPEKDKLEILSKGVLIDGYKTKPCEVKILDPQPKVESRKPPIRSRRNIPTIWIEMVLKEGKNRQVRKMTSKIGHPTLRLIRVEIGKFKLGDIPVGKWKILNQQERDLVLASK